MIERGRYNDMTMCIINRRISLLFLIEATSIQLMWDGPAPTTKNNQLVAFKLISITVYPCAAWRTI